MARRSLAWVGASYAILAGVLWFVPLFNVLHAESCAVVAFAGFFIAGLSSLRWFNKGGSFGQALGRQEGALVVPWALLTVTLLRVPNCGYAQGLLFFLLFPVVSVVLAVALAFLLSGTRLRYKKTLFVLVGLLVVTLGPLYDLGLHPQFYVYNHVFGGVLGPIYDEELAIRPGLFAFRGATLLWALLLYLAGRRMRGRTSLSGTSGPSRRTLGTTTAAAGVAVLLGLTYLFSASLGFNTTVRVLQRTLGGHVQTPHFDIYYEPSSFTDLELRLLVEDHEYRYAWLQDRLDVEGPGRIASYIYPDEETKGRLTGARRTNVAPVWLRRPQVHVLKDAYDRVFGHELAHAFSRAFGLPVLKASLAIGMVEGFAVALAPPDGLPTVHEQVSVAALQPLDGDAEPYAPAAAVASRLAPLGFWTGRGAVSYTTMGSFVQYLLDTYGADALKQVYARANFEGVYGKEVYELAQEWERYIRALSLVSSATADLVFERFSIPSLFEQRCPHHVPAFVKAYRAGERALTAGDTVRALEYIEVALARRPDFIQGQEAWAERYLALRRPEAVLARLDTVAEERRSVLLAVHLGDAYALTGQVEPARASYAIAYQHLPAYAYETQVLINLRMLIADDPEVLRLVTSGVPLEDQADLFAPIREPSDAARVYYSLRLWRAGRFDEAATQLQQVRLWKEEEAAGKRQAFERQRLVWLAQIAYHGRDLEAAHRYARQAAEAFREAGDLNREAWLSDLARKVAWLEQGTLASYANAYVLH